MLSWVFLQKSLALWALYLGVKMRRGERQLIWLPHSQPYEGGDHPDLLSHVSLSFWSFEFCPPTRFFFFFSLLCQHSDHQPPWCVWVSVSNHGWPCQTVVSEVEFLLDWPRMHFMTSLSQMSASKWQVLSCWEVCGWTEESRRPAGHTVRETESHQVHRVTTLVCPLYQFFDYPTNLYSLFHMQRKCVLYVSVSTVTKLAHTFSLRPYASMFIRNSQAWFLSNLTEQQFFQMICQEWYCLS